MVVFSDSYGNFGVIPGIYDLNVGYCGVMVHNWDYHGYCNVMVALWDSCGDCDVVVHCALTYWYHLLS